MESPVGKLADECTFHDLLMAGREDKSWLALDLNGSGLAMVMLTLGILVVLSKI